MIGPIIGTYSTYMTNAKAHILETGLIPVIRADSSEIAMRAIDAIRQGGISVLEITMTVPGAIRVIEDVARRFGSEVIVGAGTVLDSETARACILAGAQFIVSPALDLDTISCCRRYSIPVMPGAMTPSEVVTAWKAGADLVKIFPANALGGPSYLKALKAPLPQVELVPTGGVSLKTAADFIKAGAAALGVGTDLVDTAALRAGDDRVITTRAKEFIEIIKAARAEL
jgi:2-dehydro-3-deoxyphosphogluconate aldolase / (4S)-4-hydroxy-2-oxoglutarate aldolase